MRVPPFRCLFCGVRERSRFTRVEHPIPESLGNDDLVLPVGFVCDSCNQYFGSKIESRVLSAPPFDIERTSQAIRTKKGRLPKCQSNGFALVSTGYWDAMLVVTKDTNQKHTEGLEERRMYATPP